MPKYLYKCDHGCAPGDIGGKVDGNGVERTVHMDERDEQYCKGCGEQLLRIFDASGMHFHWPYWMSQNVPDCQIEPTSADAKRRWDDYGVKPMGG